MPICTTCGGYYLRAPCPVCSEQVSEEMHLTSSKSKAGKAGEGKLDHQMSESLARVDKDRSEFERHSTAEKIDLEKRFDAAPTNLDPLNQQKASLVVELEKRRSRNNSHKERLRALQQQLSEAQIELGKLDDSILRLSQTIREKGTVLASMEQE